MIEQKDMSARAQALLQLLDAKLGVKGATLRQATRRAGRLLPRGMRKNSAVLVRAEAMAAHPKLARQLDPRDVDRAFKAVTTHLRGIDADDARRGRLLSLAGAVAFNLLILAVGFLVWLWWRGYL